MVDAINGIIGEFSAPILLETGSAYAPGGVVRNPATVGGRTGAATAVRTTGPITRLGTTGPGGTTTIPAKNASTSPMIFAGAGVGALVLLLALAAVAYFFMIRPGAGTTPVIESAVLATAVKPDQSPQTPVTTFGPNDTFFLSVKLNNADPKAKMSAKWFAGGAPIPGGESTNPVITPGSEFVSFKLAPPNKPWSPGDYKTEIYVNDALKKTVGFTVSDSAATPGPNLPPNASLEELVTEADRLTLNSKFDDATNLYKQANSLDPKDAVVVARWGRAFLYQQKLREAIDKLEEATKLDARNAEAWGYLALAYDWSFRFDDAFDAVEKGLKLQPNSADLHAFKAEIIVDRSEDVQAAEREVQVAQGFGQNKATVQRAVSNIAFRKSSNGTDQGQVKIAEDAQKKSIELEPNLYLHPYELGVLYLNLNRLDAALDAFSSANKLYSRSAQVHFGLGRTYYLKRQCDQARPELVIALSIDPSYQAAKETLESCR
jgi:tetratricopeptide (TPR) repeat protein